MAKYRFENPKVNLIRYADDFVVTGASRELLERSVRPVIEAFMAERGLTLSEEKTVVTHIDNGFDFLGFNVRKYAGKLLIKPSKANVKRFLVKIRQMIKTRKAVTQEELIWKLNPVIRGWVNYHAHNVSSKVFSYVDFQIWKCLWQWAKRRHPNKGRKWIARRYFHRIGPRTWTFCVPPRKQSEDKPLAILVYASDRKILRYTKIRSTSNPFDVNDALYFEERETDKMRVSITGRKRLIRLFSSQNGLCSVCGDPLTIQTGVKVHSIQNGHRITKTMVHPHCHKYLHEQNLLFEPVPLSEL